MCLSDNGRSSQPVKRRPKKDIRRSCRERGEPDQFLELSGFEIRLIFFLIGIIHPSEVYKDEINEW